MKRANEDQEETDERRKIPFFEYGIIILVCFIFVIIISVPSRTTGPRCLYI